MKIIPKSFVVSGFFINFANEIKTLRIMENNTRYIVVLFWDGVGYTYQTDNKVHWFFTHPAVAYKKLAYAKKRAEEVGRRWLNAKTCVFKVTLNERLSCDQYKDWCKDNDRLVFEFKYTMGG